MARTAGCVFDMQSGDKVKNCSKHSDTHWIVSKPGKCRECDAIWRSVHPKKKRMPVDYSANGNYARYLAVTAVPK